MKNKAFTSKKPFKNRAMKVEWDDSKSESEEVDNVNMCFMVHSDNASKVQYEAFLDDIEITFEEMAIAFQK